MRSYFQGKWAFLKWSEEWSGTDILKGITYLETIPIALSVYLWGNLFLKKKILINSDNKAVVEILNSKTSRSVRVMSLVRHIVYWSLLSNVHIKGQYVPDCNNVLADCISRRKFQKFKDLALSADTYPAVISLEFWSLLCQKQRYC